MGAMRPGTIHASQNRLHPESPPADIPGMKTKNLFRFPCAIALSGLMFLGPQSAKALTCPAGPPAPALASRQTEERAAARLEAAGLSPEEATARVEEMTADETAYVADEAPAVRSGGDAGSTVLLLVAVAAIVYIVFDYVYYHQAPAY